MIRRKSHVGLDDNYRTVGERVPNTECS
eukprot:COSAG06_NODE_58096_length_278_cov_0.575419_1_plen_27_part_01